MPTRLWITFLLSCTLIGCANHADWRPHAERVEASYAYLKAFGSLPDTIDLVAEAAWLEQHHLPRYAGEAYYVLGAYHNLRSNDSTAMYHLKQAERCWQQADDAPDVLVGMTAYKQGRISENEMLPEVALHHYRRALPYLERAGDSLYLSAVYREIGRTTTDTAEQHACFTLALTYAESLSESLRQDTRYAILSSMADNAEERLQISTALCDSVGMERYAADVVRAALRRGDMAQAAHYLDVLARDTVMPVWSNNQHALLRARYLYLSGETASAYDALETLYRERLEAMERDGAARSYTIAERFDNAAERERNLRLEMKQQSMRWGIGIGVILALLAAMGGLLTVFRLRSRVTQKHDQLKRILLQHITHGQKLENIFARPKDWQEFRDTFDQIYDGKLMHLEQQYPSLTTADLQVLALTELGLDSSDICRLLNQTKRTIWNRRQRIKKHMAINTSKL